MRRVWVQAKIQGMARSASIDPAARRLAGRDPMFILPSSLTGVAVEKKSMKRGSPRTTARYASHEEVDIAAIAARNAGLGGGAGSRDDSSTADVYRSSVRKQTCEGGGVEGWGGRRAG